VLKERYKCHHFRILIIGRANAGKTTILEKVCGVTKGTKPIVYDQNGVELEGMLHFHVYTVGLPFDTNNQNFLQCIWHHQWRRVNFCINCTDAVRIDVKYFQRGIHNIEDQITYAGSNFIFHDSQGFEAGDNKELQDVWKFIERRSAAIEVGDQLHAIWYSLFFSTWPWPVG